MNKNSSVLEEVAKKKKYLKVILVIVSIIFITILYFVGRWYQNRNEKDIIPEYATSIKKDLKISVEEDGEIKNPQDFNLAFLTNGRIEKVLVEEGQKVKMGDELAILDTTALEISVQKAQANVNNFYGLIKQKKAENTDLDYTQAQEELVSIQEEIVNKEKTTQQAAQEAFDLAIVKTETGIYRTQRSLDVIDSIFGFNNNRISSVSTSFNDSIGYNKLKNDFETISRSFKNYNQIISKNSSNISQNLLRVTGFNREMAQLLDQAIHLFSSAIPSALMSQDSLTSHVNLLIQEKMLVNQEIQNLVTAKKNIENALINQQTQVSSTVNQKNQIEVKTLNAEKMAEQKKISKEAGLSVLYAQLAEAKANLENAQYNLSLATLISPSDGEVLDITKEVGEIVGLGEPFIKILSDDNFIVEIYVEELDIVKIKIGQKAHIRVAALNDQVLNGIVSYISSNATEDSNGVITYLVRLEIMNSNEEFPIKEKMTASVEFVIDEVQNATVVPVEAIYLNNNGETSVLLSNMTEHPVKTGLSDNNFVEIISGLNEDIQIITNPTDLIQIAISTEEETKFKELLPEIKEDLLDLGFNENEIKKIEKGEMDEELSKRLKEVQQAEKGGLTKMMKN